MNVDDLQFVNFLFLSYLQRLNGLSFQVKCICLEFYTSSYEFDADLYEKSFFIYVWYVYLRTLLVTSLNILVQIL